MIQKRLTSLLVRILELMLGRGGELSVNLAFFLLCRLPKTPEPPITILGVDWLHHNWLYNLLNIPRQVAVNVAGEFQEEISLILNLHICDYCKWVIYESHSSCNERLNKWSYYENQGQTCICGHRDSKHAGPYGDGQCQSRGCECPSFGEPPENYETYTKVYLGDQGDDMGLIAYE